MKNGEPQLTSCGSTPGRIADASRPSAAASGPGAFNVGPNTGFCCVIHANRSRPLSLAICGPLEFDERGSDAEPERKFLAARRNHPVVGEREGRPDHGVSGKLHFVGRPEDAQPDVGARHLGGLDEGALGKLRFARHRLHLRGGEPRRLGKDGQLIAGQRLVGEHVVMQVATAIDDDGPSDRLGRDGTAEHAGGNCGRRQAQP